MASTGEENDLKFSKVIYLEYETAEDADIAYKSISVDKEPSRSQTTRNIQVEDKRVVIAFKSNCEKSLQKSEKLAREMGELIRDTISTMAREFPVLPDHSDGNHLNTLSAKEETLEIKRLKSKLEDEAKKLSSAVSQYGENMAQQLRATDLSSLNKPTAGSDSKQAQHQPNNSAMLQEVNEDSLFSLSPSEETPSNGGFSQPLNGESDEDLYGNFNFDSIIPQKDRINFDLESTADESVIGSSVFASASKEQISTLLSKLNTRSAKYKSKYRALVANYNQLVTENANCQAVLEKTQDTTVKRIKLLNNEKRELEEKLRNVNIGAVPSDSEKIVKLEALLEKCKENIHTNKAKIVALTKENEELKGSKPLIDLNSIEEEEMTRQSIRKEHADKVKKLEEDSGIAIATIKAQFHSQLEEKDGEIGSWREKVQEQQKELEKAVFKADDLVRLVETMESEKSEMVVKLMEAKQVGVKAVCEEEEKKRVDLEADFERKLAAALLAKEKEFGVEMVELRDKMNQEFFEKTSKEQFTHSNSLSDDQQLVIDEIVMENNDLKQKIEKLHEEQEAQVNDLRKSIQFMGQNHKEEVENIIKEAEENIHDLREDCKKLKSKLEDSILENNSVKVDLSGKLSSLQTQYNTLKDGHDKQVETSAANVKQITTELGNTKADLEKTILERNELSKRIKELSTETKDLRDNYESEKVHYQTEEAKLEELLNDENSLTESLKNEINELTMLLDSKKQEIIALLADKEALEGDVKDAILIKKLQNQLEEDLEAVRSDLRDTEAQLSDTDKRHSHILQQLKEENEKLKEEQVVYLQKYKDSPNSINEPDTAKEQIIIELENKVKLLCDEKAIIGEELELFKEKLEIQIMNDKTSIFEEKISELENEIKKAKFEKEDVLTEFNKIQNERNVLVEFSAQKQVEIDQMKVALDEKSNLVAGNNDEMNELKTKLDNSLKDKQILECDILDLKHRLDEQMKLESKLKDDAIKSLEDKIKELEKVLEETIKSNVGDSEVLLKNTDTKLETLNNQVASMKSDNDTLRNEFIEKESMISELRSKIDMFTEEKSMIVFELNQTKDELKNLVSDNSKLANEASTAKDLREKESKLLDNIKILEQELSIQLSKTEDYHNKEVAYQNEIENLIRQVKENEIGVSVAEKYREELELVKRESESKIEQLKLTSCEKDELDTVRSELEKVSFNLEDKAEQLASVKGEKMHVEDLLRDAEKKITEATGKLSELKESAAESTKLATKLLEKEDTIHDMKAQLDKLESNYVDYKEKAALTISSLETKIAEMEESKAIDVKKAMGKADNDQKRMIKELQKEVKQLYKELSTNKQSNDCLTEQINSMKGDQKEIVENGDALTNGETPFNGTDYEELNSLREKVLVYHSKLMDADEKYEKEVSALKEEIKKLNLTRSHENNTLENALEMRSIKPPTKKGTSNNYTSAENYTFAEPTEAEYLRNILFRYMSERETLGKDNVTLARVIATVAKFSSEQLDTVLSKEEARHQSWLAVPESSASAIKAVKAYGPKVPCITVKKRTDYDRM
uniref:GRIP domain-containing protein n=1 Tax=Rhabditophanes sp. KR3021 TaxID=114890 RepID=A0AC35TQB4_9BILA